ncbi:hypothetical protein DESUT3_17340 [Desulfuromonas versatilis]|uniref:Uncharacterized protein n=1 Tax=Desulfuromonas versatilis TaxID=2802975 RepID=A0ABM8HVT2_9BACT|nr:hypothetical protein [Desulfuromonas versatilis]BCR04665.1 hypothetical protein DESUT3_17340 [Desulfuromonas versatilis]
MRKNLFALIMAGLLVGAFALPAMAADCSVDGTFTSCDTIPDANGGAADLTGLTFSPNVTFAYLSDGNKYLMGTFNSKGTKTYGADSDYSGLYQTKDDVTSAEAIPTDQSAAWDSDTWAQVAK